MAAFSLFWECLSQGTTRGRDQPLGAYVSAEGVWTHVCREPQEGFKVLVPVQLAFWAAFKEFTGKRRGKGSN